MFAFFLCYKYRVLCYYLKDTYYFYKIKYRNYVRNSPN